MSDLKEAHAKLAAALARARAPEEDPAIDAWFVMMLEAVAPEAQEYLAALPAGREK